MARNITIYSPLTGETQTAWSESDHTKIMIGRGWRVAPHVSKGRAFEGGTFHYHGNGMCRRERGPRGGVKVKQVEVRSNGACKVWSTRPEDFRLPYKYGMYEHGYIDHERAHEFHAPEDCPMLDVSYGASRLANAMR